jgi:4-amino-4-deoxy-L-arabinose transferase-like glycosyltransferase
MTDPGAVLDRGWHWVASGPGRARLALVALCLILFLPWFADFPLTDRDEALFAQSSRQMAETGDVLRIRFLDEARNKKPVGIYWLQSAAVTLTTGPEDNAIWPYRMPSLIGAILAVLLTHSIALRLMSAQAALAAGFILAASMVLAGEARLAKTDAALLAATIGSMAVLVRVWIDRTDRISSFGSVQFWGCLAATVLLKGPIGPLVVGLTLLALGGYERRWVWAMALLRGGGPLLFLAITAPWYLAITWVEGWSFWEASLGRDLLGKVAAGQEGHGLPPGSHLLALVFGFWPGSALLLLALLGLRSSFGSPTVRLALAWVLPFWIVLELTPTKLLHYPLPVFPALAMLAADRLFSGPPPGRGWAIGALAVAVVGLAVPASLIAVLARDGSYHATALVMVAGGLVSAALFARQLASGRRIRALGAMLLLAATGHWATLTVTAQTPWLWPSAAVARQIADLPPCPGRLLVVAGFNEPSMAFVSPMPVAFVDVPTLATALLADPCVIGVIDRQLLPDLIAKGASQIGDTVEGFAIGSGRRVSLAIVQVQPG